MKVFCLVLAFCAWCPSHAQFFYSHYTPLGHVSPFLPQPFVPAPLAYSLPHAAPNQARVTYNIPPTNTEFHGFGYRTDYNDGSTATVFYVTGAEAEQIRNLKEFPNFTKRVQDSRARSLASDITDNNAIPDAKGKIQSVLKPVEFQKLFDSITPGIVNFYTFPASTVPLALAKQLNVTQNSTTTTTESSEETVAAESVVDPKVIVNTVDKMVKLGESTTQTSSTTEAKETPKETTTVSTEEETTISETTTKKSF